MSWLVPACGKPDAKIALSDLNKRKETLQEFIYYVFDSLLVPLIRSNFHVTESNAHQNRLFYFRHDVWRSLTEPVMSNMRLTMFEDIQTTKARKMLDARALGFSQIRLLPKASGLRPITNLRRRVTELHNGKFTLGRSINSVMAPVFNILDYEKTQRPDLIGSALFSVGDIYPKLKAYKDQIRSKDAGEQRLYFAKVDARSCFDTIPQRQVVKLVKRVAAAEEYWIGRHAEIKAPDARSYGSGKRHVKPARRFVSTARAATEFPDFSEVIGDETAKAKRNVIFVDNIVQAAYDKSKIHGLLEDHVERNIIKIGKKFHRQKSGIPQGSVLSSLLCNYFYAELEKTCFGFLDVNESILLRLIDDFLVITPNKRHAQNFLQIMHDGVERYGVEVNPGKSLANFHCIINGQQVPQVDPSANFPYCGILIHTGTLEITKDRDRRIATGK